MILRKRDETVYEKEEALDSICGEIAVEEAWTYRTRDHGMNEWMNEWMDERMNEWMDGWKNEWMNEWTPVKQRLHYVV